MTDANLMDAKCIHGNIWDECSKCDEEVRRYMGSMTGVVDYALTSDEFHNIFNVSKEDDMGMFDDDRKAMEKQGFIVPNVALSDFPDELIKALTEIDRNARAYGWEIGHGQSLSEEIVTSDDNPFMDPDWRSQLKEPKPKLSSCQKVAKREYHEPHLWVQHDLIKETEPITFRCPGYENFGG